MSELVLGRLSRELSVKVVNAYRIEKSLERAYLLEDLPISFATYVRMIRLADEMGVVELNDMGRPRDKRERAKRVVQEYAHKSEGGGYTRVEQARLARCSESTIYKALEEIESE